MLFRHCDAALQSCPGAAEKMQCAVDIFLHTEGTEYKGILTKLAEQLNIHRYTADMLLCLHCAVKSKEVYQARGIPEQLYYDTMRDLTCKLYECHRVYGVWGTFVGWWFRYHCKLKIIALGRLQFELIAFPYEEFMGVKKGDTVYNFHIPADGPLTLEAVINSFRLAYRYFGLTDLMPIYLNSWLIYPPTAALYPKKSNLDIFYHLFHIIDAQPDERSREAWRIFDREVTPENMLSLPENTSLQRRMKAHLLDGGCMGHGKGLLLFDGTNIKTA